MSATPILNINEVGEAQNNKYLTINNAINALAGATNDIFTEAAAGAGPVNLTDNEATRYFAYHFSGGSGAFNVVFPSVINTNNVKRIFNVVNDDATYSITVKASTGAGTTVVLAPGESAIIEQNYQDMTLLASGVTAVVVKPYDIAVFIPGLTTNAQLVARIVVLRAFEFADDFAGSDAVVGTNPTATATFTIKKNGSSVGTLDISTAGAPTFTTTGTTVSFVAGDTLEIESQATADATMADISISLFGERA